MASKIIFGLLATTLLILLMFRSLKSKYSVTPSGI